MRKVILLVLSMSALGSFAQSAPSASVVFVDMEYVLSKMPEIEDMRKKVEATEQNLLKQFEEKQKQFQSAYQQFSEKGSTMPDSTRQKAETQLRAMQAELRGFPDQADQTLANARQLYLASAYLKIGNAINTIAKAKEYKVILPLTIGGVELLYYANPALNISDGVLAEMGINVTGEVKK